MEHEQFARVMVRAGWQHDRRLRRDILELLYHYLGDSSEWVNGETVRNVVNTLHPEGMRFKDESHCIRTLRTLRISGLAEERQGTRRGDEKFAVRHLRFRITYAGILLIHAYATPNPLVD